MNGQECGGASLSFGFRPLSQVPERHSWCHGERVADVLPQGLPPLATEDHVCPGCGFSYPGTSLEAARDALGDLPAQVAAVATAVPAALRSVRPEPDTWSVVEYACHIRDVMVAGTIRLYRVRTEDRPRFEPIFQELRVARFRYAERDLDAVLAELAANTAGLLDEAALVTDWERTGSRLPGEDRTARWVLRHALHESVHHVQDIVDVGRAVAARATAGG
jgi:hypothetical protein